jgi:hypothetical protein
VNNTLSAAIFELGHCHLVGVVDGSVVCAGLGLQLIDEQTGRGRFTWPLERSTTRRVGGATAALAAGRGVIAGHEVFCPTPDEIQVIDARTGKPSRPPISLAPIGSQGANLIIAEGYLIAAGPDRMMAFKLERPSPNN